MKPASPAMGTVTIAIAVTVVLRSMGVAMTDAHIPSDSLLPCPFCGSSAHFSGDRYSVYVACDSAECFAAVGECYDRDGMPDHCFADEEAAAKAWNRRAP